MERFGDDEEDSDSKESERNRLRLLLKSWEVNEGEFEGDGFSIACVSRKAGIGGPRD